MTLEDSLETLSVSERDITDACGKTPLPVRGVVEKIWDTDPIPIDETERRAGEAIRSLSFDSVPDGGDVAISIGPPT